MDRVIGVEHLANRARRSRVEAERLRHRRAATERCERRGLLRLCTPRPPGRVD